MEVRRSFFSLYPVALLLRSSEVIMAVTVSLSAVTTCNCRLTVHRL